MSNEASSSSLIHEITTTVTSRLYENDSKLSSQKRSHSIDKEDGPGSSSKYPRKEDSPQHTFDDANNSKNISGKRSHSSDSESSTSDPDEEQEWFENYLYDYHKQRKSLKKKYKHYYNDPSSHPDHKSEWKKFYQNRTKYIDPKYCSEKDLLLDFSFIWKEKLKKFEKNDAKNLKYNLLQEYRTGHHSSTEKGHSRFKQKKVDSVASNEQHSVEKDNQIESKEPGREETEGRIDKIVEMLKEAEKSVTAGFGQRNILDVEPYKTCFSCFDQLMGLGDILGPQSQIVRQIKVDILEMEMEKSGSSLAVLKNKNVINVMLEIKTKLMISVMSQTSEPEKFTKITNAITTIGEMTDLLKSS